MVRGPRPGLVRPGPDLPDRCTFLVGGLRWFAVFSATQPNPAPNTAQSSTTQPSRCTVLILGLGGYGPRLDSAQPGPTRPGPAGVL